ncbi:N-lysine methyltransferase SMYD2-A (Histone methyltransferase SMYD2-A) (SET and MYND domain-containing protein 2A) [Durusdinium trenchii]|uniref:N-lysine methyltransferase SMYD2-A (Histone methyltransferase SMYD2-A) (SET and MYND domain-containing protein 2A) n=1 Tax=Durusdinium trenchii TaxID=1381693 RepID=A0ABP0RLJ4_9DINO
MDGYDLTVGTTVEVHGLISEAGSRFNGCTGVVAQINKDGRYVIKLRDSSTQPVVKPCNLRKASPTCPDCIEVGDLVEITGLTSERGRWLNEHLGCVMPGAVIGRLSVKICATGQEKAIKELNLLKHTKEVILERAQGLLEKGHLYDLQRLLRGLPFVPECLSEALTARLAEGTHSEILGGTLKLVDISGKGKGYRAERIISAGEALLFDTAFCSTYKGPREYHEMETECKKKTERKAVADFFATQVMTLASGPSMMRMIESQLISILKTNVFQTIRDPDHVALFPAVSRFNHSCCANAFADTSKTQATVRALCDIRAGEEVCVSYCPVHAPRQERMEQFFGKGFDCNCERCKREVQEDPQFLVPCKCGKHSFSAQQNAKSMQRCPHCSLDFLKETSLGHLQEVEEMNAFMRTQAAAAENPLNLIETLKPLVERVIEGSCLAPKTHNQTIQLLNNFSGAHYFAATRVPGPHQSASFAASFAYKKKVLRAQATNHGQGTCQRDMNYFMSTEC